MGAAEADTIHEAAATIRQAATQNRVTKIQEKEVLDKDGNVQLLTTTTEEGPSLEAAVKLVKFDKRWKKVLNNELPETRNRSGPQNSTDESRVNELDDAFERAEGEAKDDTE